MNRLSCPRCDNVFYTAAKGAGADLSCPYCGFAVKQEGPERRRGGRTAAQTGVTLAKGELLVSAKAVDVSDTGVGIRLLGRLPFERNETVSVTAGGLKMEKTAVVMWTKKALGVSMAGLRFC
jgi:hypothetical protein